MIKRPENSEHDGYVKGTKMEAFMNNQKKPPRQLPGSDILQTYQKPVLTVLGELRTLTLAPTQTTEIESELGTVYGWPILGPDVTSDQFENRSGIKTDSGGRSGRG